MAKYEKYAEYKDSGFNAFGEIPSHWEVLNLRYVFDFLNEKRFPLSALERAEKKGSYPYYGASGIIDYVDEYILDEKTILIAEDGANLLSRSTPLAFIADGQYWVNNHAHILKPKNLQFGFWTYFLQSLDFTIYITGSAQPKLSRENLGDVVLLKPSFEEQTQIANFLDHETAKIDSLIAKQEKLIELLKEKRQAVISHAVTKGLNPNVPMKDSGVAWLGEVPEHWVVKSYRLASRIYRGKFGHRPRNDPAFYDGDYPFIQTGDVARAGKYITSYSQTLNEKGKEVSQLFPKGTLMMAIAANIGDIAILGFEAYAPDSVVGFKPNNDIDLEFLRYSFIAALPALEQTSTQSTQANLNVERIGAVKGTFPSLQEQREIVGYLDNLLEQYRNLVKIAENAISLMQERRTALISAAVTGKIDVRHWQAPTLAGAQTELSA
ncbi:restriction endonuclease subunit S [Acinetobacter baumannii]